MAGATPPSSKRRRIDYEKTFKVLVGSGDHQKTLTIHDDLVVHRSTFFKSARSSAWSAGDTPIDLTDEEPDIFATYMHCVQYNEVDVPKVERGKTGYRHLFRVYVQADKLGDVQTANLIIDEILAQRSAGASMSCTSDDRYAYTHTVAGSPLRRLITDWNVHEWGGLDTGGEPIAMNTFPQVLVQDMAQEFVRLREGNRTGRIEAVFGIRAQDRPKCHYHQHNDKHPRCDGAVVAVVATKAGK